MSAWFRTYGFAEILDTLVIGAYPRDAEDAEMLERVEIQRVLNLVDEREYERGERLAVQTFYIDAGIEEQRISFEDFGNLPPDELEAAVQTVLGFVHDGLRCYLHCRAGQQRSAIVATGVVAIEQHLDLPDALRWIKERRPTANPLEHQLRDLAWWWERRQVISLGGGSVDP